MAVKELDHAGVYTYWNPAEITAPESLRVKAKG